MSGPMGASGRAAGRRRIHGAWVAGAWALLAVLLYTGVGDLLSSMAEGIDPAFLDFTPALLAAGALVAAVVSTVLWARRLPATRPGAAGVASGRRRFLLGTAAFGGGLLGALAALGARIWPWYSRTLAPIVFTEVETTSPVPQPEWTGSRVRAYRRLGRTEFRVSDISLGSGQITYHDGGEALAREAIERGVNYFDTAPDYAGTDSEKLLGHAMRGRRDQMFVATKFCTADGHLAPGTPVQKYIEAVEGSLRRLQTDYVDLVHIHSCDTLERLLDPNAHEAFERLKQAGKARFLGFSTHTPHLVEVANAAIDDGRFDVMMLAYHHGSWPALGDVISRAARADMGVVAMKTLKGAKHEGLAQLRGRTHSYAQAAFRWVLSNPDVSCLVISFFKPQHVDEYLYASGTTLETGDLALLEDYDEAIAGTYCAPHCGACLDACPAGVPIDDVLRHRMYFEDYGRQKLAMQQYAKLERRADLCIGCAAPCAGSCPQGIRIQQRTTEAHAMLTLG